MVHYHLQLVLHHYGEVDPVFVVWLDEWYALLYLLWEAFKYCLLDSQVLAVLCSSPNNLLTSDGHVVFLAS